jgi:hypothetical protein
MSDEIKVLEMVLREVKMTNQFLYKILEELKKKKGDG